MNIFQKVSLSKYSTMRLGGVAQFVSDVTNKEELLECLEWAEQENLPVLMIGTGSNIIWSDEGYKGLLLINKMKGFEILNQDQENLYITIAAGENWDEVVARVVEMGFSGIESLSLIPGTVGATPVQNVGAYGSEISSCLVSVEAYDLNEKDFVVINNEDCNFGYRTSRFKTEDAHRFLITAITLHLTKKLIEPPFYAAVQEYFSTHNITEYSPLVIRNAVIQIRQAKLPDPQIVANCGSFFTNPIVSVGMLNKIKAEYPTISYWQVDDNNVKLAAAWLVEEAGFKAVNDPETGMSTWPVQPLVLVNTEAKNTADLIKFKTKIVREVKRKFGVTLAQEPETLP